MKLRSLVFAALIGISLDLVAAPISAKAEKSIVDAIQANPSQAGAITKNMVGSVPANQRAAASAVAIKAAVAAAQSAAAATTAAADVTTAVVSSTMAQAAANGAGTAGQMSAAVEVVQALLAAAPAHAQAIIDAAKAALPSATQQFIDLFEAFRAQQAKNGKNEPLRKSIDPTLNVSISS